MCKFTSCLILIVALFSTEMEAQNFWKKMPFQEKIYSMVFNSQGHLFLGSDSVKIYRSMDGGQSFEKFFTRSGGSIYDNVSHLVVNSRDSLFATLNFTSTTSKSTWRSGSNGELWSKIAPYKFSAIVVDDNDRLYGALSYTNSWMDHANIRISDDDGDNWTEIETDPLEVYAFTINDQKDLFIGSYYDGIFCSRDNGASWDSVFFGGNTTCYYLNTTANQNIIALYGSLCASDTYGENWEKRSPPVLAWIQAILVFGNDIYAGYAGGPMYKSSDAGLTWTAMDTSGLQGHLSFSSLNQIAVDPTGYIWIATNAEYGAPQTLFRSTQPVTAVRKEIVFSPDKLRLFQNYPNPFNPTTLIKFDLQTQNYVRLDVYNVLGQNVRTLVNSNLKPGKYRVTFDASGLGSGIYIYKLQAGPIIRYRKMALIR